MYWLIEAEQGKRKMRKVISAWRLSRAPWNAKLIKLADLIDNSEDICRHDRHFAPVYLRAMMARVEGSKLTGLPLFRQASSTNGPTQAEGPTGTRVHQIAQREDGSREY